MRDGLASTAPEPVRIAVVGGGLIAQAAHLPLLNAMPSRFRVLGVAEPSARVRGALADRFGIRRACADHRAMLEDGSLDAVLVCSPNATHEDVVLDALDAGLHVFVEKPLCLSVSGAERIACAQARTGLVVQVGYMKRFDPAYEALLADLPGDDAELRHITTVTHDPWLAPYFAGPDVPAADDVPAAVVAEAARRQAEQVGEAVGVEDPAAVACFSDVYLGALVHDVNAVRGLLDRLDVSVSRIVDSACTANGTAATGVIELSDGVRWTLAWLLVRGLSDFREEISVYAADGVRRLVFPAPYLLHAPTEYSRTTGGEAGSTTRTVRSWLEAYRVQLEHFHACVKSGAECRTPVAQARTDIELLTALFEAYLAEVPA